MPIIISFFSRCKPRIRDRTYTPLCTVDVFYIRFKMNGYYCQAFTPDMIKRHSSGDEEAGCVCDIASTRKKTRGEVGMEEVGDSHSGKLYRSATTTRQSMTRYAHI